MHTCSAKSASFGVRVLELLTASLKDNSSFPDRKFENVTSLEPQVCEDLAYLHFNKGVLHGKILHKEISIHLVY